MIKMKQKKNQLNSLSTIPLVILAGGKGSRLQEYTNKIPKPLLRLKNKPLIDIIIDQYKRYGVKKVIVAAGYKYKLLIKHFKNDKNIQVVNTGINSLTGLRIKKIERFIKEDNFFLTYGDGISNINIKNLFNFHLKHNKIGTVTGVHPPSRFGVLNIKNNVLKSFDEKPQLSSGWINGGYFVFKKEFFNIVDFKNVMLERDPMTKICKKKQMNVFLHKDFWRCIDTVRDLKLLEEMDLKKYRWLKKK